MNRGSQILAAQHPNHTVSHLDQVATHFVLKHQIGIARSETANSEPRANEPALWIFAKQKHCGIPQRSIFCHQIEVSQDRFRTVIERVALHTASRNGIFQEKVDGRAVYFFQSGVFANESIPRATQLAKQEILQSQSIQFLQSST